MKFLANPLLVLWLAAALVIPSFAAFADDPIAEVILKSDSVLFVPQVEVASLVLTISSPCGIVIRKEYDGRETPTFALEELQVENLDGVYKYRIEQVPFLTGAQQDLIADLRKNGDANDVARSQTDGLLPKAAVDQSGSFTVLKGAIITETSQPEKSAAASAQGLANDAGSLDFANEGGLQSIPDAQVISGDLTVYNSLCVGFDCLANESYGSDTIRLKENNLRIHFEDTSAAAGFPTTDWRLIANDQSSGGGSYFSIQDASAGRRVFSVEANAPSHSLYVDNGGRVGIRTSNPVVDLHVSDGDTPTLRLEQTGASGFAPQTWDVAGNETSFFIRDATNGSTLPFRIRPGAASNSLVIDTDDDVGIGTLSPTRPLHVVATGATDNTVLEVQNNGPARIRINNGSSGEIWNFGHQVPSGTGLVLSDVGDADSEFLLDVNGNLTLTGTISVPGGTLPDYVFEDDYPLMSIDELAAFIGENKHLPNIPSAEEVQQAGTIDLTDFQRRLLEKIEELTLYTIDQHETLATQGASLTRLKAENGELKARLAALEALLTATP